MPKNRIKVASYHKRFYDTIKVIENKLFFNQPTFNNGVPVFFRTICIIMWVIWFLFVQVNDTDLHSKLKNEYRKREQELMIEQLRSDPKTVPKPSKDEMMRMPYETSQWPKNSPKAIKRWDDEDALWKATSVSRRIKQKNSKACG